MIKKVLYICVSLLIITATGCATSGKGMKQRTNVLTSVEVMDGAVELKMVREFNATYTVYKPADPYTVIVELPDVTKGKGISDTIASDKSGISEVKIKEEQEPSHVLKVELLLESPADVVPETVGNSLLLRLETSGMPGTVAAAAEDKLPMDGEPEETPAPALEEELAPATELSGLSFSYRKGALRFTVKGNGSMEPEIFTLEGRIIIDVPGVSMKAAVPETVVSPVKAVRYGIYDTKVRLVLDIEREVDFVASTVGDTIVISIPIEERLVRAEAEEEEAEAAIDAIARAEEEAKAEAAEEVVPIKPKYTGKRISLDFQDADIVPIFRFLGDIAGYNVVIHPNVKGTITLKLLNVPWDQALDIILEISNLDKAVEDNILRIAPLDVFAKQKEEAARLKSVSMKAAELVQTAIHLEHINATEMQKRLTEAKVLTPRGTTRIDERTNTLIINDVEESINKIIEDEIPYWDTAEHGTLQVLIEARIVEVNTDYSRSLGIRWGASADQNDFSFITDASTYDVSVNTPVSGAGVNDDAPLGVPGSGGIFTVGYTETIRAVMSLEALEIVSKVKNLANPRVLTIDKEAAVIKQGVQIPFSTTSAEGTKTEFQEAVLSLDVTPEIQPNGILKLTVNAKNDTQVPVGNAIGINKEEVNTQALVKDGQTLVLGGIYRNSETSNETRVPLLGRIPLLGWFFKTKTVTNSPKELLIFITPKIVK